MADEVTYEVRDRIATRDDRERQGERAVAGRHRGARGLAHPSRRRRRRQVGALCITGAPGMFSGGFDLAVMRSGPTEAGKLVTDGGALITRLFGSEVPVVIACTGHAVAAGALLLLGADVRIGVRGAFRIGLIETEIGLVLPRWAAELARERLVATPLPARDGRCARCTTPTARPKPASSTRWWMPTGSTRAALEAARRWAELPRAAYRGQVRMNRSDVLGRLADAVADDRGRLFDVPA